MDRIQILNALRALGMTQQTVARLSRIPADRLSRYLKGNAPLHDGEAARLNGVIQTALQTENGTNDRLCESLPVDWSRVALSKELETAVFAAEE
jgi:transcriptional regulator with XRE-family HTH domain